MVYGLPQNEIIESDYHWFIPPAISRDNDPRIGARIEAYAIPKNADSPALAIDCIEFCITHRNWGQPDLLYMLTQSNPEANGIDEKLHSEYLEMLPYITFHINAIGGTWASYDLAYDFCAVIEENWHTERPSGMAERIDKLIENLNSLSKRVYYNE